MTKKVPVSLLQAGAPSRPYPHPHPHPQDRWGNTHGLGPAEGASGGASAPCADSGCGPRSRAGRGAGDPPGPAPTTLLRLYMAQAPRGPSRRRWRCGRGAGWVAGRAGLELRFRAAGAAVLTAGFRFPATSCRLCPPRGVPLSLSAPPDLAAPQGRARPRPPAELARPIQVCGWKAQGHLRSEEPRGVGVGGTGILTATLGAA